jgi:hypothetical protein
MEKSDVEIRQYISQDMAWPTGLKTAEDVAPTFRISPERLMELAEAGYAPHWRIDGQPPLFRLAELKEWGVRNLALRYEGRQLPIELRVTKTPTTCPATDAPACIREIPELIEIPTGYPTGIYFLVHDDEVVYVGQSVNPTGRIATHTADERKQFDRAYMVPVPLSRLDDVESALIRLLRPRLNRTVIADVDQDEDFKIVEEFYPGVRDLGAVMRHHRERKREIKIETWKARMAAS